MEQDTIEGLSMTGKTKILDFYKVCVKREHSELFRLSKLGRILLTSIKDEETKTTLKEIIKKLDSIYEEMKGIV